MSSYCSVSCVNCERFSLTAQKNQYALTAGCRIGHIRFLGIGLEQVSLMEGREKENHQKETRDDYLSEHVPHSRESFSI